MATTIQHPDLGEVNGQTAEGVVQFLGLQYASLKDRFASPELRTDYTSKTVDATKFGQVL